MKKYFIFLASLILIVACAPSDVVLNSIQKIDNEFGKKSIDINQKTSDLLDLQDKLNQIVQSGDLNACKTLEMEPFVDSCEAYILSNNALNQGNPSICTSASKDAVLRRCEYLYKYGVDNGVPSFSGSNNSTEDSSSNNSENINYVGLSVAEAENLAEKNGTRFRVVNLDGEPLMVTMDYVEGRINATVENGVIISFEVE